MGKQSELSCRICGVVGASWRMGKRQPLCKGCARTTPNKVSKHQFERAYWPGTRAERDAVPFGVKREFYADYLAQSCTLLQYIEQTTSEGVRS